MKISYALIIALAISGNAISIKASGETPTDKKTIAALRY